MFGREPPSIITHWILWSGLICCRSMLTPLYDSTAASSALMPSSGAAAACAGFPINVALNLTLAMQVPYATPAKAAPAVGREAVDMGCVMRLAWTPAYAPASINFSFPPPSSSAGVPRSRTRPTIENCFNAATIPRKAAMELVAIRL